ncbi:major facilitator superfamily domain-containing protein [Aspergillus falconensis]
MQRTREFGEYDSASFCSYISLNHDNPPLSDALQGFESASDISLLRRIDLRILPIMFLAYFLQFLDKVCLNYSNVMGIQDDLSMSGNDFSWLATAFFIAYAVAEIPQGYLLQKYPVTRVLGGNIFIWGVMLCCSAAVQNYTGLLALRILLGMSEAVIAPALTIYTSMWYTPAEATPRFGLWYCGLGTGQILGGLISFGAQHASSSQSFSGWRIMFLVIGLANIAVSFLVLAALPVSPETASFLSADAKGRISYRLRSAATGGLGTKTFHAPSVFTTLTDAQTWLLCLLAILTLIKGFGYTSKESALLNTPSGVVSILSILLSTYAVAKGHPRWLAIDLLLVPTLLGSCLMSFLPESNQAGVLVGIYMVNTTVAPLVLIFAWMGANFKGYTGKVTGCAFISAAFSIANIIGPQTFQARDTPDYIPAKIAIVVANAAAIVVSTALRVLYGGRNREAERAGALVSAKSWMEKRLNKQVDGESEAGFRYVY